MTAYQPCGNKLASSEQSVKKQIRSLLNRKIDICSKEVFQDELCAEIVNWMGKRDGIFLLIKSK